MGVAVPPKVLPCQIQPFFCHFLLNHDYGTRGTLPETNSKSFLKIGLPIKGKACLPTICSGASCQFYQVWWNKHRSTYYKLATKKLDSSGFLNQHPLEKKIRLLVGGVWIRKMPKAACIPDVIGWVPQMDHSLTKDFNIGLSNQHVWFTWRRYLLHYTFDGWLAV